MSFYTVYDEVGEGCSSINDGQVVRSSEDAEDGVLITTSDINGSTVPFYIFERGSTTPIYTTNLLKTDVIRNTPLPWRLDDIGRNLVHRVNPDALGITLRGEKTYDMLYLFDLVDDGPAKAIFVWKIVSTEA